MKTTICPQLRALLFSALPLLFATTGIAQSVGIGTTTKVLDEMLTVKTDSGRYGILHTDGKRTVGTWAGNYGGHIGGWIGTQSNHPLYFFAWDSDVLAALTPDGNMGIGVVDPKHRLEIAGSFYANGNTGYIRLQPDTAPVSGIALMAKLDGKTAGPQMRFESNATGFMDIGLNGTGNFVVENSDAPVLTVTTLGNVGIGNSNPFAKLNVVGSVFQSAGPVNFNPSADGIDGNMSIGSSGVYPNMKLYVTSVLENTLYCTNPNPAGRAAFFGGRVEFNGIITKPGGSFKIDHPLDPENKYLSHSFVESPDMMNVYNGNITTDANGDARVMMPEWFEALNKDFRYQLTVMGQFAQAIVSGEISNNSFSIKTDKPNVKVSWQVTGIRHDAFAEKNRIPVEEDKKASARGKYLYPESFNKAPEMGEANVQ
jgi:hypothetical protein